MVQWLRLHASTAGGAGSIPSRETKIPLTVQCGQKKNKEEREIKFQFIFTTVNVEQRAAK